MVLEGVHMNIFAIFKMRSRKPNLTSLNLKGCYFQNDYYISIEFLIMLPYRYIGFQKIDTQHERSPNESS